MEKTLWYDAPVSSGGISVYTGVLHGRIAHPGIFLHPPCLPVSIAEISSHHLVLSAVPGYEQRYTPHCLGIGQHGSDLSEPRIPYTGTRRTGLVPISLRTQRSCF